jgi:hypothetical protein
LVAGKIQLVSGLDVEGSIPGINVWDHTIEAKSSRRVDIADQLIPQRFVASFSPPGLRVG